MSLTPEDVRKANRLRDEDDLKKVLATVGGRRLLWRIAERFANVSTPDLALDAIQLARTEGRRALGLELLAEAKRVAPELHAQMVSEGLARELEERRLAEATRNG